MLRSLPVLVRHLDAAVGDLHWIDWAFALLIGGWFGYGQYQYGGLLPAVLVAAVTGALWICGQATISIVIRGIIDRAGR
ncbi:hypothetical protein [Cryptosporangium sp. NPDC048952]|uniref:hypothetical protein n=1 Tax=Cryptosporangium sp. NPDC048952 TaxID=3363961 RepID=UPI00371B9FBF